MEIHDSGASGAATFKWSRENGALAAQVDGINDQTIQISYVGRGIKTGFAANDWIEVTNDNLGLNGKRGVMAQISEVLADSSFKLTVPDKDKTLWHDEIIGGGAVAVPERLEKLHTRARRWDGAGEKIVDESYWIKIENDIEVFFGDADSAYYKTGDYWLMPSRSLMKDIYWEKDENGEPLFKDAFGIRHKYLCLALVELNGNAWAWKEDLRIKFGSWGIFWARMEAKLRGIFMLDKI